MASSLLELARAPEPLTVLYLAAFGLAFGEAAFLLDVLALPGEVGLVVAGAAGGGPWRGAARPVRAGRAAGAVAGDSVSWWLGHRFGEAGSCAAGPLDPSG